MAIFKVTKDGVEETIIQESSSLSLKPDGKTKFYNIQRVVYYHKHWMPPCLINVKGKKYIVPTWTEVHPSTKLSDVIWEKPEKITNDPKVIIKKFTSKSKPDITYTTKKTILPTGKIQYSCNCPGVWVSKSRECRHMREMASC